MIPRLFSETKLSAGAEIEAPPAAAHYLASVLRLGEGAAVRLFDDATGEWSATIAAAGRRGVRLKVAGRLRPRETPPDLWLCAAPIRRARVDWVAEKACELGVARFVPLLTRRTIVEGLKLDRLRAHMIEAAEQCGRTALPELAAPIKLDRLLAQWPAGRALLFCDEEGGVGWPDAPAPAAILIGPEGGWDPAERAAVMAHPDAVRLSLGPRVLRADTAAVAAVTLWMERNGDWRPAAP